MQHSQRQLEKSEYQEFLKQLQHRQAIIQKLGFGGLPNCFDHGQRVGFFYGKGPNDYTFGTLLSSDERTACILDDDNVRYEVSPFSLFAIK